MKGLRNREDGRATSHLSRLKLGHRTVRLTARLTEAIDSAELQEPDDLTESVGTHAKSHASKHISSSSRRVKRAVRTVSRVGQIVTGKAQASSEEAVMPVTARTVSMGRPPKRNVGIIAVVRHPAVHKIKRLTEKKAVHASVSTAIRIKPRAAEAATIVGRLVAVIVGSLTSTPGLVAGSVAVAIAAAVMAILSIIPGMAHEVEYEGSAVSVFVPDQYSLAVNKAGAICPEISPSLIAAQIKQESGWNPNAVSPAGAKGISQFMPATWDEVGVDGDGDGRADIWNPTDAIVTQGHYMCDLAQQVKSAIEDKAIEGEVLALTLASYNAGFGAVLEARGIPPFPETKNYVATIIAAIVGLEVDEGGLSGDITEALSWAKNIAADDNYRYVWGGLGKADGGYDCSGLTLAFYRRLGVNLPRTAAQQQMVGTGVERSNLRPGDLIFWGEPAYHVAIYAGNGWMISADTEATGINYEPIWGTPSGYRRIK